MGDITDKERLDYLQMLNDRAKYTGFCVLRDSKTGRGWRLHETKWPDDSSCASSDVRASIDYAIRSGHIEK